MATPTTNYAIPKPAVNDPTDEDLWGIEQNAGMDIIDAQLKVATDNLHVSITGTTTIDNTYRNKIVLCDATSATFSVNLQAVATAADGFTVTIKKTDSSANAVTIDGSSTEKIDDIATYVLSSQYDSVVLICDGTQWRVASSKSTQPSGFVKTVKKQQFTISGTYTPSAGMLYCLIKGVGGGAGGGGSTGAASSAAGGGAGGYSEKLCSASDIGTSQAVVIGAGGAGGAINTIGADGGATNIGTLVTANGGKGGGASSNTSGSTASTPGLGASAGTGDLAIAGQSGNGGIYATGAAIAVTGFGGSTQYGSGGAPVNNSNGNNGQGYGAGGSGGGVGAHSGGNGTNGIVIILEFCSQ